MKVNTKYTIQCERILKEVSTTILYKVMFASCLGFQQLCDHGMFLNNENKTDDDDNW